MSGLRVYDWPTVDGVCGGSPHTHLTCSECYVVLDGHGRVQTITRRGYAETPLRAGSIAWFTPGTIHRLVNDDDLRIVVLMQNSGLPEAGDAGNIGYLADADIRVLRPQGAQRFGMCGRLDVLDPNSGASPYS